MSAPHLSRRLTVGLLLCICVVLLPGSQATAKSSGQQASAGALAKAERGLRVARTRSLRVCRGRSQSVSCRRAQKRVRAARALVRRLKKIRPAPAATPPIWKIPTRPTVPVPARPSSPPVAPAPPASPPENQARADIHVDPSGSDAAAGGPSAPVATLTEALRRAKGGESIAVRPGVYPRAADTTARTERVRVFGVGNAPATIDGMDISGGQELEISDLRFSSGIVALSHATLGVGQPARDITLRRVDVADRAGGNCLRARNGAENVAVYDSHIHDCRSGFGAGAGGAIPQSRGLTLSGNHFEHFTEDAIQFGQWDDVTITNNVIEDINGPDVNIHNDGIQLTGNVHGVLIAGNRITNSRTQLIFIQDAVGPIDDILVRDNVLSGAGAYALQSQGATNARFVHNTIWNAQHGGLWLLQGYARSGETVSVPQDTVVVNNVLQSYRRSGGAWTATSAGNVGLCAPGQRPGADDGTGWRCLSLSDMAFEDPATDLRLRAESSVRAMGSDLYPSARDVDGTERQTPVPGALR